MLFCAVYVRTHPLVFNESFLTHAHCIVGGGLSLESYAEDHQGHFPFSTNGYGAALVMLPYIVGMAVGMIWKAINAVSMR